MALPRDGRELFLEPLDRQKSGTAKVHAHVVLKRWCGVYVPEFATVTPTLLRKFYESEPGRRVQASALKKPGALIKQCADGALNAC